MTELTTVTTVGKPSEPNSSPRLGDGFQELIDELDTLAVNGGADSRNIPTGFLELDELTRGLAPGTLTVIGSHPGVGSSTLAMDFARSCAIQSGIPAAYLTLDTLPEAMRQRMLSAEAKVQLRHMLVGAMPEADWTRLARRMSEIADAPLDIQRPPERDIAQLAGQITDMAEQHGTRLVVIDPLHQLTARHDLPYENREREIAEVTRRLRRRWRWICASRS